MADRSVPLMLPGVGPEIRLGDGVAGLAGLGESAVDLVLSDLPSGETRAEFDCAPDHAALGAGRRFVGWDTCPDFVQPQQRSLSDAGAE